MTVSYKVLLLSLDMVSFSPVACGLRWLDSPFISLDPVVGMVDASVLTGTEDPGLYELVSAEEKTERAYSWKGIGF